MPSNPMYRVIVCIFLLFTSYNSFSQRLPENYYRAQAALDNVKFELAVIWIDSTLTRSPNNPILWLKRGEIHFHIHRFELAIEDFKHAENIRNGIASFWLARSYAMINDTANAFAELKRHLESPVKETEAAILLDTAFSKLKQTYQWKKLWLNDWYNPYERLLADVLYQFSRNRWDDAIDLLNQRIEGRSARHQLFALRGEAYYSIGSYRAAEADFSKALKKSRRNHDYMAWYAKALLAQGKHKKALRHLNRAVDYSGGNPYYFKLRAQVSASSGNYYKAVADIEHYLSYYPNSEKAMELFATCAMETGRNIDALFKLGTLIKNHPNEPLYHLLRAKIYIKSNNWAVAEIDLTKAIDLSGNNAEAFLLRGQCNLNLGKKDKACNDWLKARELGNFQAQELIYKYCR